MPWFSHIALNIHLTYNSFHYISVKHFQIKLKAYLNACSDKIAIKFMQHRIFHFVWFFMSYIFTCLRSSSPRRCCLFPTWWWVQRHRKGYKMRFGSCDRWKPTWFEPLSTAICVLELDSKNSHYFRTIGDYIWAIYNDQPAEVTLNGGLVRESPKNLLNQVKDL